MGSTQPPLQLICVPGHETAHVPAAQTMPLPQVVPGLPASLVPQPGVAPQNVLFEVGSMHPRLQLICVPGHETAQIPPPQTVPLPQATPGLPASFVPQPAVAPQCRLFEMGSTHSPLQSICEPGQLPTHAPTLQAMPLVHGVPQAPQLAGSPFRFAQ